MRSAEQILGSGKSTAKIKSPPRVLEGAAQTLGSEKSTAKIKSPRGRWADTQKRENIITTRFQTIEYLSDTPPRIQSHQPIITNENFMKKSNFYLSKNYECTFL